MCAGLQAAKGGSITEDMSRNASDGPPPSSEEGKPEAPADAPKKGLMLMKKCAEAAVHNIKQEKKSAAERRAVALEVRAHTHIHTHTHTHIHTYYTHTRTHTYIHAYIHTYIHTYIHACIHTYMHTYIHTCMNTCKHT